MVSNRQIAREVTSHYLHPNEPRGWHGPALSDSLKVSGCNAPEQIVSLNNSRPARELAAHLKFAGDFVPSLTLGTKPSSTSQPSFTACPMRSFRPWTSPLSGIFIGQMAFFLDTYNRLFQPLVPVCKGYTGGCRYSATGKFIEGCVVTDAQLAAWPSYETKELALAGISERAKHSLPARLLAMSTRT